MKILQKIKIVYDYKNNLYLISEKRVSDFEIDLVGEKDLFEDKWSKYRIHGSINSIDLYANIEASQNDIEEILVAKYEELKPDFELLWDIRNDCYIFENWWYDFLSSKL